MNARTALVKPFERASRGISLALSLLEAPSGSGSRGPRIHTSRTVVDAPTLDRAFARWCFTVECDSPSRRAAAYELDPSDPCSRAVATGSRPYHVPLLRRAVRRVNEARSALPVVR